MRTKANGRSGRGGIKNTFNRAIAEIKRKSEMAGKPVSDAEIAKKLSLSQDEYFEYVREDSVPMYILQLLASEFRAFSTLTIEVFSSGREIDPPPPPDPSDPGFNE